MTISNPASRNDYVGNNATAVYPYTFQIFSSAHLLVTVRNTVTGVETTLTIGTDYTVSGVNVSTGGNVTLVNNAQAWLDGANLDEDYALTIRRVLPITQTADIRNQGDFYPEVHENEFDALVMIDQQNADQIAKSVRLPETVKASDFNTLLPTLITSRAGLPLIVNATGNGWDFGLGSQVGFTLVFGKDTYPNLKATAAAAPTVMRMGWATDTREWVAYVADASIGDNGWIVFGGG